MHYFHCDLASPDAIKECAAQVKSKVGHPTVLVNNAGFARGKTIMDLTDNDLRLNFQVNAISHYQLAHQFLPSMIQNNHGMIVTVASLASYVTAPAMVDYSSSKAAALTFPEGLTSELATVYNAPKVRTVVVCQGFTRTPLFDGFNQGDPFMNYPLDPETVAEDIVRAVLAGKSDHIILPRNNSLITTIKGWPSWMQIGLRKDMKKMMKEWKGRQVLQPSEIEKKKEDEKALGESTFEEVKAA